MDGELPEALQALQASGAKGDMWSAEDWEWDALEMRARPRDKAAPAAAAPCGAPARLAAALEGGAASAAPAAAAAAPPAPAAAAAAPPAPGADPVAAADPAAPAAAAAGAAAAAAPGKRRRARGSPRGGSPGAAPGAAAPGGARPPGCQAAGCGRDLAALTFYHARNRICDVHIRAASFEPADAGVSAAAGAAPALVRFCQRCGHAHALAAFDGARHSCREQLERHNARRRKRAAAPGGAPAPGAPAAGAAAQPARRTARRTAGRAARRASSPLSSSSDAADDVEPRASPAPRARAGAAAAAAAAEAPPPPPPPMHAAGGDAADDSALADVLSLGGLLGDPASALALGSPAFDFLDGDVLPALGGGGDGFAAAAALMAPLGAPPGGGAPPPPAPPGPWAPAAAPRLPAPPPLTPAARLSSVSIKLYGCTPGELPPDLRRQLAGWFESEAAAAEGYLRPGCLHLTVQAVVEAPQQEGEPAAAAAQQEEPAQQEGQPAAAGPAAPGASRKRGAEGAPAEEAAPAALSRLGGSAAALRRVVAAMLGSGEPLWRAKTMLVAADGWVALVAGGCARAAWRADAAPGGRAAPAVVALSPPVLLAGAAEGREPQAVVASGVNLLQDGCELLLRLQGRWVAARAARCAECACAAAARGCAAARAARREGWEARCCGCCVAKLQGAAPAAPEGAGAAALPAGADAAAPARLQAVRLELPPGLPCGLLHVDAQLGSLMGAPGARALVVGRAGVAAELLAVHAAAPAALAAAADQLGLVAEREGAPAKVPAPLAARAAARLLCWAVSGGLLETAGWLLDLLGAGPAVGALPAAAAAAGEGAEAAAGLLMLQDAAGGARAAAAARLRATLRAVEAFAARDGLSLLHRAVQSQRPAMVAAVLAWGEAGGAPWRCDVAGPAGLTPLHLAALAADAGAAAEIVRLLLARCAPGAPAWGAACAADGASPRDFAARAGRAELFAELDGGAQAPATAGCCVAKRAAQAQQQQHAEDEEQHMQPSTPRRCFCPPGCPCASADDPCACAAPGAGGDGCCGGAGGGCCCCDAGAGAAPGGGGAAGGGCPSCLPPASPPAPAAGGAPRPSCCC